MSKAEWQKANGKLQKAKEQSQKSKGKLYFNRSYLVLVKHLTLVQVLVF